MAFPFRSKAAQSAGYRADIDGLRAIAVLSVLGFHAHVSHFSGGYVGVDVFFVISGYLITGILERKGFSFLAFYDRRIRRIFPALFAACLACTLWGIYVFPPQQLKSFGMSLLGVSGFVSNLYFRAITHITGYFGDGTGNQYLLHTWSLSVEEQFYLLFPILLASLKRFKTPALLVLAAISFALSARGVKIDPIPTFYLLPGRAWELVLGALLALKPFPLLRQAWIRSIIALSGLASIVYAVVCFTDTTTFPGPEALFPCVGTALILYAGEDGDSLVKTVMSLPPLVFVGVISYSLYLWHWPVIAATKFYYSTSQLWPALQVRAVLISFVFALLSYAFVEAPFRRSRHSKASPHTVVWAGVAGSVLMAAVGLMLVISNGLPRRFNTYKSERLAINYARKADVPDTGSCVSFRTDPQRYEDVSFCKAGQSAKNILFWGDSHAAQLYPLLQSMQQRDEFHGKGFVTAMAGGCPIAESINRSEPGFHCDAFTHFAMMRAEKDDIDTVFFVFSPFWTMGDGMTCASDGHRCVQRLTGGQAWAVFLKDFEARIRALQNDGKRVVITVPFPLYGQLIPDLLNRNLALGRLGVPGEYPLELVSPQELADMRTLAARTGASLYDPRALLCPGGRFFYQEDYKSLYSDQSHLATSQLERLRPGILAVLDSSANTSSSKP